MRVVSGIFFYLAALVAALVAGGVQALLAAQHHIYLGPGETAGGLIALGMLAGLLVAAPFALVAFAIWLWRQS